MKDRRCASVAMTTGRRVHRQAVCQKVDDRGLQQLLALVELDDVRRLVVWRCCCVCGSFQRHWFFPIGELLLGADLPGA